MKTKNIFLFLTCSILCIFCSCTKDIGLMEYNSEKHIDLYDYSTIEIDYDYTKISEEDIKVIIETELSVNEAYVEITDREYIEATDIVLISIDYISEFYFVGCEGYTSEFDQEIVKMKKGQTEPLKTSETAFQNVEILGIYRTASFDDTDFILDYYNYSSLNELKLFIEERASNEIVFNYIFDKIYENSILLSFPDEIEKQIETDIQNYTDEILNKYSSLDNFLEEFGMTYDDFKETFYSRYYEIMLYKAILDKDNISITAEDIENFAKEKAIASYNPYDLYEELASDTVRKTLLDKAIIRG